MRVQPARKKKRKEKSTAGKLRERDAPVTGVTPRVTSDNDNWTRRVPRAARADVNLAINRGKMSLGSSTPPGVRLARSQRLRSTLSAELISWPITRRS